MFDSKRYANIFSADTDNNDVFVMPFMFLESTPEIGKGPADEFISLIYGTYQLGFILNIVSVVLAVLSCCAVFIWWDMNQPPDGKVGGEEPPSDSTVTTVTV